MIHEYDKVTMWHGCYGALEAQFLGCYDRKFWSIYENFCTRQSTNQHTDLFSKLEIYRVMTDHNYIFHRRLCINHNTITSVSRMRAGYFSVCSDPEFNNFITPWGARSGDYNLTEKSQHDDVSGENDPCNRVRYSSVKFTDPIPRITILVERITIFCNVWSSFVTFGQVW